MPVQGCKYNNRMVNEKKIKINLKDAIDVSDVWL